MSFVPADASKLFVRKSGAVHSMCVLVWVARSDEMEIIMSDLERANEVSFAAFTLAANDA